MLKRLIGLAMLAVPAMVLAQASPVQPGMWDIAVTIQSIDMPGQPAAVTNMMRGKTNHVRQCITAADAARGPQELMKSAKGCTFTKYSMLAGRLSSVMQCKQGGGTMTAVSNGSFTPTSFTVTGKSTTTGNGMAMTMTSTSTGKRVGPCK